MRWFNPRHPSFFYYNTSTANLKSNYQVNTNGLIGQTTALQSVVSWNKTITKCLQNSQIIKAQKLFDKMPLKDIVSYNTILSGLNQAKNPEKVCQLFLEMERVGLKPNEYTLSIILSAVLNTELKLLVPQIHARTICLALNASVFVGSALMKAYANAGDGVGLSKVFNEILNKDVSSWNALVSGYMELGRMHEAQKTFDTVPDKDVVSWTTLVNGYIRNNRINKARSIFNKITEKNVISWTVMISGYVQNERFVDALKLFVLMMKSDTMPNKFTYSSVLDACAGCCCLLVGQQVHSRIIKFGIPKDVVLSTSLVDMYAKCGDIDAAFSVFESMQRKNLASWNSMIGGYGRHGLGKRALEEFERMIKMGVKPDEVTFVNVLSACGHGGLVEEGEKRFDSMETKYGIKAEVEHYACMVDLYGRAGQLDKAEKLIKEMPFEGDVVIWGALLGGCGLHSNTKLGELAAESISRLKKDHPAVHSMLTKIHGEKGAWSTVVTLRKMLNEKRFRKQEACSWVESPFHEM
ncbi:pentatricopeptide repeat-containing protein At4g02750-like [Mangifera indica]|uniref:pentatricopeptide repeat-containing protein At4g02750-like n=1 Tax=Mangifera indica TaxID=29780 RepID=UPI001CFB6294|nr:pentatricopeptide repeat-containing protein At4g02750-like [Mangifera indica]